MCLLFNNDEGVDAHEHRDDSHDVQQVPSCQYNAEVANLLCNDLVLQGVKAKNAALLYVIQTPRTLVNGLPG